MQYVLTTLFTCSICWLPCPQWMLSSLRIHFLCLHSLQIQGKHLWDHVALSTMLTVQERLTDQILTGGT